MPTYSAQLFAGEIDAFTQLYVATSEFLTVVRDIQLWNAAAGASDVSILLQSGSGSFLGSLIVAPALGGNRTAQWQGRVVMTTGQQLFGNGSVYPIRIIISGYHLSP